MFSNNTRKFTSQYRRIALIAAFSLIFLFAILWGGHYFRAPWLASNPIDAVPQSALWVAKGSLFPSWISTDADTTLPHFLEIEVTAITDYELSTWGILWIGKSMKTEVGTVSSTYLDVPILRLKDFYFAQLAEYTVVSRQISCVELAIAQFSNYRSSLRHEDAFEEMTDQQQWLHLSAWMQSAHLWNRENIPNMDGNIWGKWTPKEKNEWQWYIQHNAWSMIRSVVDDATLAAPIPSHIPSTVAFLASAPGDWVPSKGMLSTLPQPEQVWLASTSDIDEPNYVVLGWSSTEEAAKVSIQMQQLLLSSSIDYLGFTILETDQQLLTMCEAHRWFTFFDKQLVISTSRAELENYINDYISNQTLVATGNLQAISTAFIMLKWDALSTLQETAPELMAFFQHLHGPSIIASMTFNKHGFRIKVDPWNTPVPDFEGTLKEQWSTAFPQGILKGPFTWQLTDTSALILVQTKDLELIFLNELGQTQFKRSFQDTMQGQPSVVPSTHPACAFMIGRYLHVVGRDGNDLHGFPVRLSANTSAPPLIVDFNASKDWQIFVLQEEGAVYGINQYGAPLPAWNPNRLTGTFKQPIQPILTKNEAFLLAVSEQDTLCIMKRNGLTTQVPLPEPPRKKSAVLTSYDRQKGILYESQNGTPWFWSSNKGWTALSVKNKKSGAFIYASNTTEPERWAVQSGKAFRQKYRQGQWASLQAWTLPLGWEKATFQLEKGTLSLQKDGQVLWMSPNDKKSILRPSCQHITPIQKGNQVCWMTACPTLVATFCQP